jgi:putative transposase
VAHRYRLYPSLAEQPVLARHSADARYVWNLALEQANCFRPGRPTPGAAERSRQLTEARSATWLGQGSSSVQQQALRDFDQALRNWWGGTHRRPTWRQAGVNESFCVRDVHVQPFNRRWAELHVPKLGFVRFRLSRSLPATYGMARISLDRAGRWHVSFAAPQPAFARTGTGEAVGLDMGIVHSVSTSSGAHHDMGTLLSPGEAQRKRRLQRKLSRQVKGSKRRSRTKASIARIAATEADRRRDWMEQTTTAVVRDHDVIAIEDLKVHQLVRSARGTRENPGSRVRQKAGLNRSIGAQAWSRFRRRLEAKAAAASAPVEVIAVNPAFTSQRCSACGHITKENRKNQAAFACVACELTINADVNAAINILAAGLAVTGRGGTSPAPPISVHQAQRPDEASTTPGLVMA